VAVRAPGFYGAARPAAGAWRLPDPFFCQRDELVEQCGNDAEHDDGSDYQSHLKELRLQTARIGYPSYGLGRYFLTVPLLKEWKQESIKHPGPIQVGHSSFLH